MSNLSGYDKNSQIEIATLTIKKPGNSDPINILPLMDQFIIYEDLFQSNISAKLIFRDQVNLVGSLPIVSGETISIKFRTPIYTDFVALDFIVYEIGERDLSPSANIQLNELMLCTPEVWWSANNNISAGFSGTYSSIISKLIKETGTKKTIDIEESIGIVSYVPPSIDPFQAAKFCARRANTKTMSPLFLWESTNGYNLKSLKEIYRASYNKTIYIEDRSIAGADSDANKVFNTVYDFDYLSSNNRLRQYADNAFGVTDILLDFTNKRIIKVNNGYDQVFHGQDIKLNKFPLNDDAKSIRGKDTYMAYRTDLSHMTEFTKSSNVSLMSNLRVIVNIPGDSGLRTGAVVSMDIPAKVALEVGTEPHSSGKWLARSIKHLITKTTYSMVCELTKDSFDADVASKR